MRSLRFAWNVIKVHFFVETYDNTFLLLYHFSIYKLNILANAGWVNSLTFFVYFKILCLNLEIRFSRLIRSNLNCVKYFSNLVAVKSTIILSNVRPFTVWIFAYLTLISPSRSKPLCNIFFLPLR